ncbi:quinol oxidase subunit 4 [Sphingobacterium tabacisoli]|uniref:Quinol oxidase subunit 4 n=1 Tax=Sphingobacterium tabacisoli TaxID=2044855 RepID=A0ABW5L4T8_9SPHI|nr:quinol oxidase subunit 4 [Sphingobacterium tabacisoli]
MMKIKISVVLAVLIAFGVSSCYVNKHPHGHVPPGQAKKVHGDKSAKEYAPGQQKHKRGKGNNR